MFNQDLFNENEFNGAEMTSGIVSTSDPGVSFTISDELGGGGDDEE